MKATKKAFSLVLALAMLASFVTVPAFGVALSETTVSSFVYNVTEPQGTSGNVTYTLEWASSELKVKSANSSSGTVTRYVVFTKEGSLSTGEQTGAVSVTSGESGSDGTPSAALTLPQVAGTYSLFVGSDANNTTGTNWSAIATISMTVTAAPLTITVDLQGGTGGSGHTATLTTGADGKLAVLPPTPTKANATFIGWFDASTGGSEVTTDTVFTADASIYARWDQSYTVTFNVNTGTADTGPAPITVANGTVLTTAQLPDAIGMTHPTAGMIFNGWYTGAGASGAGDTEITSNITIAADTTIYAGWVAAAAGVKVPATVARVAGNAADPAHGLIGTNYYIDLGTEKLVMPATGYDIAAFSIDGGTKWKAAAPTDKDIVKLLNKGGQLVLTNSYDAKAKAPTKGVTLKEETFDADGNGKGDGVEAVTGAITLTFAKVEARPKDTKLAVNYGFAGFKDDTGLTNGKWTLGTKGATAFKLADVEKLEVLMPADGKKPADGEVFVDFPDGGITVKNMSEAGKAVKTTYYVRQAANDDNGKYTPASKGFKVSASSAIKAPGVKVDYKKETMKTKAPMNIFCGSALSSSPDAGTKTGQVYVAEADKLFVIADKAGALPLDVSEYLSTSSQTLIVWAGASEKKPASQKVTIKLAKRAAAPTDDIAPTKGKVKLAKGLEAKEKLNDAKWGGFPKITKSGTVFIRTKSAAKGQKLNAGVVDDSGQVAASGYTEYQAEWGIYNPDAEAKKQKSGFTAVMTLAKVNEIKAELAAVKTLVEGATYTTAQTDQTAAETAIKTAVEAAITAGGKTVADYGLSYVFSAFTASSATPGAISLKTTISKSGISVTTDLKTYALAALQAIAPAVGSAITVPANGGAVTGSEVTDGTGTGFGYTIKWYTNVGCTEAVSGNFAAETIYYAKITFTPTAGYTLTGTTYTPTSSGDVLDSKTLAVYDDNPGDLNAGDGQIATAYVASTGVIVIAYKTAT